MLRIFDPIFGDEKKAELELFSGEHTRIVTMSKLNANTGLGKFAVVSATCMGCKKVLKKGWNDFVCEKCMPNKKNIYIERKIDL